MLQMDTADTGERRRLLSNVVRRIVLTALLFLGLVFAVASYAEMFDVLQCN
jgi:hypothetical protein